MDIVDDPGSLRTVYPMPSERAANKVLPHLGDHMREFIELSPFIIVATSGDGGRIDASPRGDAPGFVRVIDAQTLQLPDRPGNNRLDSSQNLLSDAHVGMIFFVPGVNESLRVNGQACITFDNRRCEEHAVAGKPARSVWVITVDEAFFHCGKALIRSDLWNPEKRIERSKFPSYGQICADQFGGKTEDHEKSLEESYRTRLY